MDEPRGSVKKINALKARQNFGQMLEEVYYKGDRFVIERAGRPMAAVVPLSLLEEWQKHHSRLKTVPVTSKDSKRQSNKRRS
jgi:prevent-host-death family protein